MPLRGDVKVKCPNIHCKNVTNGQPCSSSCWDAVRVQTGKAKGMARLEHTCERCQAKWMARRRNPIIRFCVDCRKVIAKKNLRNQKEST